MNSRNNKIDSDEDFILDYLNDILFDLSLGSN